MAQFDDILVCLGMNHWRRPQTVHVEFKSTSRLSPTIKPDVQRFNQCFIQSL